MKKTLTAAEKIEKLENAVKRYEQLLDSTRAKLAKLKYKEQKTEIEAIDKNLIKSGKSVEEIKDMLQ